MSFSAVSVFCRRILQFDGFQSRVIGAFECDRFVKSQWAYRLE